MSLSDDEENLFDDIYADDDVKKEEKPEVKEEEVKEEESKEESKQEENKETSEEPKNDETSESNNVKEESTESSTETKPVEQGSTPQSAQSNTTSQSSDSQQQLQPQVQQQQQQQQQQDARKADLSRDAGKMFIGGLDWDTNEDRLKEYFSQYGEVIDHTIMREPSTGRSRGFGFLTFADKSSVDAVVRTQHVLDGKVIDPKRAIPREEQDKTGKIFVGGIPPEVRPHEFESFFAKYGTIIDAQLMLDKDTGRSRGFGFVTFDSPEAVDKVCQGRYIPFGNRQIEVKRAEPRGPQQQQNHIASQQQRHLQQQQPYGYNPIASAAAVSAMPQGLAPAQSFGAVPGVSPEQLKEYYEKMDVYWTQIEQQGGPLAPMAAQYALQFRQQSQQLAAGGSPGSSNVPVVGGSDNDNQQQHQQQQHQDNLPRGPRGGYNNHGGNGYRGRGRGGYNNRRGGGYHPYSRN